MRHHLHFISALCLVVAAAAVTSGCNQSSGSAGQQPGAKQTASQPNAPATANAPVQTANTNGANTTPPAGATNTAAAPNSANAFDACALLTSDDIKAVQGEAVKESKPSHRGGTDFAVASCFYATPTFTKSVSLEVTRKGASSRSVREFWKANFAAALDKREQKNERRKKQGKPQAGEPAKPVSGIGDEAYWISTNANSTLYAFKNDTLVRISIGGADKEEARMKKIKTLAERALARL
ncbi:MAG: hypothetical protein LC803_14550 [Acidobacteria bacterium]|nr:hypothetical protein [Acidobacteriota bacterium]